MSEFKTFIFQKSEAEPTYYELGIRGQFGIGKEKIYTEHFEADLKSFKKIMGENRAITHWVKMWNKNWPGDSLSFVNIDVLGRVWTDRNNRGWPQWLRTKCRNGFIKQTITTWDEVVVKEPSMLARFGLYFGDLKTNISHITAFVSFFHDNYSILVEQLKKKKQSSGGTMPSILNFPLQQNTPETFALATSKCIDAGIFLLGHGNNLQDAEGLFDNDDEWYDEEGIGPKVALGVSLVALLHIQFFLKLIYVIILEMPVESAIVLLVSLFANYNYDKIIDLFS
jgi:hypothetical protein|tara:strand:+ start:449 stop:1294 length:846 start_codon:yes stop_codon:yes gene_type:complete